MPAYTFFYDAPIEIQVTPSLLLDEEESHHLSRVMRLKVGDQVELLNGRGFCYGGHVESIAKQVRIKLDQLIREEKTPSKRLHIVQGLTALGKVDWIVEKLTELGADSILFFGADHSSRDKLTDHQKEKLRAKAISAIKQSGRLWLPEIRWLHKIEELKNRPFATPPLFFTLDPKGKPLAWQEEIKSDDLVAIIGPESGLSEKESKWLESIGALPIAIHEHILRAETASIASCCLLHQLLRR